MKKLFLIAGLLVLLSSCSKSVLTTYPPDVSGTWTLAEASRSNGLGWQYINSNLDGGLFDFYRSGAATYDDGHNLMRGSWKIYTRNSGYYDQYGQYYNQLHHVFEVNVYDGYTGASVDMYFDQVIRSGNLLIAAHYDGYYVYRYVFQRY